jgi:signal transduction histidine kinase
VGRNFQYPLAGVPQHPLRRNVPEAILGGVCAGIACRLGIQSRTVRVLAALTCLFFGAGLVGYIVIWLFLRRDGEDHSIAHRLIGERRTSLIVVWGVVMALLFLIALSTLNLHAPNLFAWSVIASFVGSIVVWRKASTDERRHLDDVMQAAPVLGIASARGWRALVWRALPATLLIIVGLQILSHAGGVWAGAVPALVGGIIFIVGALVLLAPWWLQNVRDLSKERRSRVRAEERAALIAHVHDSVLQTLTLIERSSDNPAEVTRLARVQERELRAWLFAPDLIGVVTSDVDTFVGHLQALQNEVERDYGVRIELVTVGDCPVDQRLADLIAAAREAAVNAARWSGDDHFSVFGEVDRDEISIYVRDAGVGFDPEAVAADRQGLSKSIRERVRLAGGQSSVRSALGEGTEIAVTLHRAVTP